MEDGDDKILELESYWLESQALCKNVNEQLAETQNQYETLDKKYNKAKKLLKDYQQKWVSSGLHNTSLSERFSGFPKIPVFIGHMYKTTNVEEKTWIVIVNGFMND